MKQTSKQKYLKKYREENREKLSAYRSLWSWRKRTGEKLWLIKEHNEAIRRLLASIKRPQNVKKLDEENKN